MSELRFERYIGIDYSGAQTPTSSLKGLRIYACDRSALPTEVLPPAGSKKYWSRRGVAEWLARTLIEDGPAIVGIDHGFSFPLRYFERHHLTPDWPSFLDDFVRHWPTDEEDMYVDFIRDGVRGTGAQRSGNTRWRRITEKRAGNAKSVFHFDVPGQVAKSTFAGLPWLRYLRRLQNPRMHFWPFDGWDVEPGRSVVLEVYPSLCSGQFPNEHRTADQHDAYAVSRWLQALDRDARLSELFSPALTEYERTVANVEGWIFGVP